MNRSALLCAAATIRTDLVRILGEYAMAVYVHYTAMLFSSMIPTTNPHLRTNWKVGLNVAKAQTVPTAAFEGPKCYPPVTIGNLGPRVPAPRPRADASVFGL